MALAEHKLPILEAIDRAFDLGTRENYFLNHWLLFINVLLLGVFALDIFETLQYVGHNDMLHEYIRDAEIIFGMLFLMEFTLRSVFVYIPDKKFLSLYSIINVLVIVSLLAPHFIGNLALLRFLQIFKVYKVFRLTKDQRSYHTESVKS